jgi:DNA-binding PadR family transcriptional regulator
LSSDAPLTFFELEILCLVGRGGAGPHDLARYAQTRMYSNRAASQFYAVPKRLEKLGYLTSRKEPGRTHERTHYMLTEKAYDALREWLREPSPVPRTDTNVATRLLAADLVGERPVFESLLGMRAELDALDEQLVDALDRAKNLPHREKYLRLSHTLSRRLLAVYRKWLDEVERELDPDA